MPSYLEREQIQQLPPYLANTTAVLNTFNTKLQYWASGAARVKSAYDKYLGMDLSLETNQAQLKQFMQGAKDQLKRAAHTDLSIGDNQVEALNIFSPLTDGKTKFSQNIMGDNAITNHYRSQLTTAESYRGRDGGKEYSDTNVNYLSQHLNDFVNENNPDAWRKYYGNKRYYSPYYDYHAEIKELMDGYKPNSKSQQATTSSLYFHTIEDKSTTSEDALRYINANLSDKAREQMKIEGNVMWHDKDDALIQTVANKWQGEAAKYNSYATSLEGKIRVEKDPVAKAQLEQEQVLVKKRLSGIQNSLNNYNKGDYSEITKNKEVYQANIYTDNLLDGISTGWARTDYTEKYTPDAAAINMMQETGRNNRAAAQLIFDTTENALDRANALDIARIRSNGDSKATPGSPEFGVPSSGDTNVAVPLNESNKKEISMSTETLNGDLDVNNAMQRSAYLTVYDRLANRGMITPVDDDDTKVKTGTEWLAKMSEAYTKYSSQIADPNTVRLLMEKDFFPGVMETMGTIQQTNQNIYSIAAVKEKLVQNTVDDIRGLYTSGMLDVDYNTPGTNHQVVLSPGIAADFFIRGDRSKITEKEELEDFTRYGETGMGYRSTNKVINYYYNGRQLNREQMNNIKRSIDASIQRKYDSAKIEKKNIWSFGPNSKVQLETAKKEVLGGVTHDGKEPKEADFQILGHDEAGNIYFKGDAKIEGATRIDKDKDGRYFYYMPSQTFKIDENYTIPPQASGVKYFFDKQLPFLNPGQTISTPVDSNFFEVGGVKYRVEAQKDSDFTTKYNLYEKLPGNNQGEFIGQYNDFYSLATDAMIYPRSKKQKK